MARRRLSPHPGRDWKQGSIGAVLAAIASITTSMTAPIAMAQPCAGPVTSALGASDANRGEKFRLIADQCEVLAEPITVRRAAQLGLYDRGASITINLDPADSPPAVTPPASPASPASPRPPLPAPSRDAARILSLAPALTNTARAYDLDPLLLHSIAHVESRHNADAVSKAGARGVMQVMPATARRFGVTDPERTLQDADTNLRASAALLQTLFKRYGDDVRLVLAAYNAGEGAVDKFGRNVPPYPETQAYVRDVMATHRRLTAEFAVTADGVLLARGGRSGQPAQSDQSSQLSRSHP